MEIKKIEAARRQLTIAVELLFRDKDPVAVCTLSHAAFGILKPLAERHGESDILTAFKDLIRPGFEGQFWNVINRSPNFFKHADRDPEGILDDFEETGNDHIIILSYALLQNLGGLDDLGLIPDPFFGAFFAWYVLMYPETLKKDSWIYQYALDINPIFKKYSRSECLEMIRIILRRNGVKI